MHTTVKYRHNWPAAGVSYVSWRHCQVEVVARHCRVCTENQALGTTAPDLLKRWIAFLRNHRAVAGMDLFTVPTATLNVLYGFFVIHHDRRRILHFNATYHPTATASHDRRPS